MTYTVAQWVLIAAMAALAAGFIVRWFRARGERDSAAYAAGAVAAASAAIYLAALLILEAIAVAVAIAAAAAAALAAVLLWSRPAPVERAPDRTADLEPAAPAPGASADAEQARIAEYIYMVSHDLQEPLRMVIGFGQLLERRYSDKLDEQGREFLQMSTSSAARMSAMLADLLRLSRVEQAEVPDARVALGDVLEAAIARQRQAIQAAGAKIAADPLPLARGSMGLLADVFQELIANSLKYRSERPPVMRLKVERLDATCVFTFEDNGIGFDPRFAERIFKPFQRLHNADAYPGTGMGLAIARRIVERHGGTLDADATPGEGSRFTIRLPCEE